MLSLLRNLNLLIYLSIFIFGNCGKKESVENFPNTNINYGLLCEKIQDCYNSYYRTIPLELQEKLSISNCKDKFKVDFEKKISLLPLEDIALFENCYNSMMSAPCKKFTVVSIADPSCSMLRKKYDDDDEEESDIDNDHSKQVVTKKKLTHRKKNLQRQIK